MLTSMPALDTNQCGDWTENQITAYQSLPFYLAKLQVDMKNTYPTFSRSTKKIKWTQNQGSVMRAVRTNPSPHLRQFANPRPVTQTPLTDVVDVRETINEASVKWQDFRSPIFNWFPAFNDFMDHIQDTATDLSEKIERFNEVYIRGMMFHMSPFVIVCNANGTVSLVLSPYWSGSGTFDGGVNQGKTAAFLSANLPTGTLQLSCIEMAMTIAETDLGIPFFSGSELPKDDQPLDGKFLIVTASEQYNQFIYDQLVKANRTINFDVLTSGFKGSFFGRATSRLESLPLRYEADGTFDAPQLRVDASELNGGETLPNPDYTSIEVSPYTVNWLIGKNGYQTIETGMPPKLFTSNTFPNAPGMDWSGVPRLTKNFLIQCIDEQGNVQLDTNSWGRYLRFQAEQTFGILAAQRRNAIPILSVRKRGPLEINS